MSVRYHYIDPDGYTAEFSVEGGKAVLTARSDSGNETSVYLSADATRELAAEMTAWAEGR
jgi:hypothetical protein